LEEVELEFRKLTLDRIRTLRPYFMDNICRICDCTVGGTFMWRDYHRTEYAVEDGVLYLKVAHPEPAFAPPRGAGVGRSSYERIIGYCAAKQVQAQLCSVSETALNGILEMFPDSKARTNRAWSDYLYMSEDLANLAGRRYAGQRNHINRFIREHPDWSFERVTGGNIADVRAYIANYAQEHIKDSQAYQEGNKKTLEALDNLDLYGQLGGALFVAGKVVGASLGEALGDTLFVHAEKADTAYHGSYPMLMNQFAKCFATDGIAYINREEDDGVEGLRTSKLSYHPTELLNKYMVELR
jgi:hypothetical protein